MHFLSRGDFSFPFTWHLFFVKQFFTWSYQTGAVNADGIIRMPGRLLDLFVFMLFGNVAFEYFYIVTSLAIIFAAFYFFARHILNIKNVYIRLVGALFFTFNPIVLGNLAKIGLVFAAAMLPLSLLALRAAFIHKKIRYFLFWIIALNISLIHPFTFTVNLVVSGCYFMYLAIDNRTFVRKNLSKFGMLIGLALLLNAYFILPIASIGTISKNAITSTASTAGPNYAALVNTLNTGNIFTGFSLSKDVVLDFNFYNDNYKDIYFLGAFAFYILLIGLYIRVEKRLDKKDKRTVVVLLGSLLVLIALATVTFLHLNTLIDMLIQLPGGWAFRSPLKWQLYIPLPLYALLVLLLQYIGRPSRRILLYGGLALIFTAINGFLFVDIYRKLLVPHSITQLTQLQKLNLDHKNMLFISGDACPSFEYLNPSILTEFHQIMASKNVQQKTIDVANMDQVNLSGYDFVMSCADALQTSTAKAYNFKLQDSFVVGELKLFVNTKPRPYVYATPGVFSTSPDNLSDKYRFVTNRLKRDFVYIDRNNRRTPVPTTGLQDLFAKLSFDNLKSGAIEENVNLVNAGKQHIYIQPRSQPLYYMLSNSGISFSTDARAGYQEAPQDLDLQTTKRLRISYLDPSYKDFRNLIQNPSLERGLWQKSVGDCYDYDQNPQISMSLDKADKTDGQQSLQLRSGNHIACTGPEDINVKPNQQYLISFDYESPGGSGGYSIDFNDTGHTTISGRLTTKGSGWHTFTRIVTTPPSASNLHLTVDAYPDYSAGGVGTARYDNFKLAAIPHVQDEFYLTNGQYTPTYIPTVQYRNINPTKTSIAIKDIKGAFVLATSESYNSGWRIKLDNSSTSSMTSSAKKEAAVLGKHHLKLNDATNGWYIDPAQICRQDTGACTTNADGSYNIKLTMEFAPQRWFYIGSLISGITFMSCVGYFGRHYYKRRARSREVHYVARR